MNRWIMLILAVFAFITGAAVDVLLLVASLVGLYGVQRAAVSSLLSIAVLLILAHLLCLIGLIVLIAAQSALGLRRRSFMAGAADPRRDAGVRLRRDLYDDESPHGRAGVGEGYGGAAPWRRRMGR